MNDMLIGPGPGCHECGDSYGRHSKWCRVPFKRQEERIAADIQRGRDLADAIRDGDSERIGRVLRGDTAQPPPLIKPPPARTIDDFGWSKKSKKQIEKAKELGLPDSKKRGGESK